MDEFMEQYGDLVLTAAARGGIPGIPDRHDRKGRAVWKTPAGI